MKTIIVQPDQIEADENGKLIVKWIEYADSNNGPVPSAIESAIPDEFAPVVAQAKTAKRRLRVHYQVSFGSPVTKIELV